MKERTDDQVYSLDHLIDVGFRFSIDIEQVTTYFSFEMSRNLRKKLASKNSVYVDVNWSLVTFLLKALSFDSKREQSFFEVFLLVSLFDRWTVRIKSDYIDMTI